LRLAAVGIALWLVSLVAWVVPLPYRAFAWVIGLFAALVGIYLLLWATLGKGRWCRQCKIFRT
jgi:hypothetical protein